MYLHELGGIIRKGGKDQSVQWQETNAQGAQLFSPAAPVVAENGFDIIFVNGRVAIADGTGAASVLIVHADPLLVGKQNLGIRNHGG